MEIYYGDIHNHCGISYGHGPLKDALANARQQLDFCSVTGHAHWPDMPSEPGRLDYLVDYHRNGFAKLAKNWQDVIDQHQQANQPGKFVTFLSFEWHNMRSGDHTIYYRDGEGEILRPANIEELHSMLAHLHNQGVAVMANPHHIGYAAGRRGINWDHFDNRFSPVVEMMSMHGCAETDESPKPYLHTMGPYDYKSSMRYGLEQGYIFGIVGSTDHHSAFPGSYGHGRLGVWAESLTREDIWDAIYARRTYALTGDRIELDFSINGQQMGSIIPESSDSRNIHISVKGGGAIDYVELIKNSRPIYRSSSNEHQGERNGVSDQLTHAKILLELGWGSRGPIQDWDVRFGIEYGEILAIEPRFRGPEIVAPVDEEPDSYAPSQCKQISSQEVRCQTKTQANPTTSTSGTQGVMLEIKMPRIAKIWADFGEKRAEFTLKDLIEGARTGYLGGFVTPAFRFGRAVLPYEFNWHIDFTDKSYQSSKRDWYYVRVCQKNGQWAWSSPIWVGNS